jgi:hypothetical protein
MSASGKITAMDDFSAKIEACIVVELLAANVYLKLARLFPEAKPFFMELYQEESDHAAILTLSKGYHQIGKLPEDIVPDSFSIINETLTLIKELKAKLDTSDISLKEALEMALKLEKSVAEDHLQETLNNEHDSDIIKKLRTLQTDSRHHAEKIENFMRSKGLLDKS